MPSGKWAAKAGAIVYILWGVFHLLAAQAVNELAKQSTGLIGARLQQGAFYILAFALAAIAIASILNWRNSSLGYWLNGILLCVADIPFVLFVLGPGLIPLWPGIAGPSLWLIAIILTTVGRLAD